MKKTSKIIAAIMAFTLIIGLVLFVNAWVGNPISKAIAAKSAKEYVAKEYNEINLVVEKSVYNFKFGSYMVFFRSHDSYDTAFSVYVDSLGKVVRDDYEYEVANNFTTWRRLDSELREIGDKIMREHLTYDIENAIFTTEDIKNEDLVKILTKDIHNPPFGIEASVRIKNTDVSYEKMAEVMQEMATLCKEENIPIVSYSIALENDALVSTDEKGNEARENQRLQLYNIPANLLDSENLALELQKLDEN